jgi:hypothetical protein
VNTGPAYALGSPELQGGSPNLQAQQTVAGSGIGAKVIRDASFAVTAQHRLYGVWYAQELKIVCAAVCINKANVDGPLTQGCALGLPVCGNGKISWTGPDGGGQNRLFYPFQGAAAGDYRFRVDLMVDAYGTRAVGLGLALVLPGEYATLLTLADVAVPA